MQELLGRIARLDPTASLGLRVIACFDELVVGNVNTRALLSAAASLAGCVAGFTQTVPPRTVRVSPRGEPAENVVDPVEAFPRSSAHGLTVWLERTGPAHANDAIILERLALAVRIRHGYGRRDRDNQRELGIVLDPGASTESRSAAAGALGLTAQRSYRVLAAPLFAVWTEHPVGIEDVVPTVFGPIHAMVVPATTVAVDAGPVGVGVATPVEHLPHSFRTALVALRLCRAPVVPCVSADEYGGLIGLIAETALGAHHPDADLLDRLVAHAWAAATVEAVMRSGSLRQAARVAGVHHSTMQSRVDVLIDVLGWDPLDAQGRTRLGIAYLVWRLRHSRVLDLPAPG